ncbi:MAG: glycerophosphodiester phosphodiesterase family protein [Spirochaetia bacterium]|jgi:glycerophosphoryl diester phosphodiesterase
MRLDKGVSAAYCNTMNIAGDSPLVLGHRGYRARFPENTLLAFGEALAAGADGVECDVQKSADGRFVIIHDQSTDRVTGVRGEVGGMTLNELRSLDFGVGERIPLLEDLLAMLPLDAYLDLELKEETLSVDDCGRIAQMLYARRDRGHLMISSFKWRLLVSFRKEGFTVGYLVGEDAIARGAFDFARTLLRLRPHYLNLPVQIFARIGQGRAVAFLRFLRACGFSLLFWTINTMGEADAVARFARIIVTDEVELLVRDLKKRSP